MQALHIQVSVLYPFFIILYVHIFIYDFRNLEVALGDYILNKDPDCTRNSIARLCHPPKIVRKVNDVVIHENYDPTNNYNNIALIRLEELVPLHTEDPIRYSIFIRTIVGFPSHFFYQYNFEFWPGMVFPSNF